MEATNLALDVNTVSEQLQERGHRVVVRRLRGFLEAGDALGAERFLSRAKEALGSADGGLGGLVTAFAAFTRGGGDLARLVTEPAWVEGAAREKRLGRFVEAIVTANTLGGLVDQLAQQQRALAAREPLAAQPARQMAPKALPPLPTVSKAPAVQAPTADSEPKAALGNIFRPAARGRAVIENDSELEERSLELDFDDAKPTKPAGPVAAARLVPEAEETPAPPLDVEDDPFELPEMAQTAPSSTPIERAPIAMPSLHAPPEMSIPTAPAKAAKSGGAGALLGGLVVLAAAGAAAAWYFLQ